MRIVHIASEFAPIAKAGGLGEVLVGLAREETKSGNFVDVIIPKYDFIPKESLPSLKIEVPDFKCLEYANTMWQANVEGTNLHLLEARHPAGYFHRGKIYGLEDDIPRFIYFCRAALEYLRTKKEPIDILHLHDWHTSLCAPLARDILIDINVGSIVLSIHNIAHQGKCASNDLDTIGIDGKAYLTQDKLQDNDPNYPETINLLKGGLNYADAIVPVSLSYAKEILTPKYGCNLHTTLKKVESKIHGIINGIDTALWNPTEDRYLIKNYSNTSFAIGKAANKKKFSVPEKNRPWVGAITRLVHQKGPELIEEALIKTLDLGGAFFLLGSSPIPSIQAHFDLIKEKYRTNPNVFLHYQYDEKLAHLLFAALDFLIIPSLYEPCGLTQLIAMNYGTVPIVRKTGGLKDTVFDCEDPTIPGSKRNGFTFQDPTPKAIHATLERAFQLFRKDPFTFETLIRRGMQSDFSWKKPAQEYLALYRKLLRNHVTYPVSFLEKKAIQK